MKATQHTHFHKSYNFIPYLPIGSCGDGVAFSNSSALAATLKDISKA